MKVLLAGCVIVDDYERILLLHRNRGNKTWWELPGGKVEEDELAEEAAVRELAEELGVQVRLIKTLGSAEFEDDAAEYTYQWFQATISGGQPHLMEPEMFDDYDYFELDDLLSLALSPNMQLLFEQLVSGEVALQTPDAV